MVEELKCKECGCIISAFECVEFDGLCYQCAKAKESN